MESLILFIFGCIASLMFLGMLYGDRLNMIGLFDGEWLSPVSSIIAGLWTSVCEGVDRGIEFVLAHLSWVVAAVSGTAGLTLVAFILGGGLAVDAEAYHRDTLTPLKSGGVIDKVDVVSTRAAQGQIILAKADRDDSNLVSQTKSADYFVFGRPEYSPIRPRPRRPIDGSINIPPTITERPLLDVTFRRLSSSVIETEHNPDVITRGRLVDSLPNPFFVDRILARLSRDNWRESLGLPRGEDGLPQDDLPESPLADVKDLESPVRVTPGTYVSKRDLRVEKTVPQFSASGDLTIQISVTNLGDKTIDGLLVRELLPIQTRVRGAIPDGVLRQDTLTWLVDNLRPAQEYVLRFTVIPAEGLASTRRRDSLFESTTEVSAVTAVTSLTRVDAKLPPVDPFPADLRRRNTRPPPELVTPELVGAPDLRLEVEEPLEAARVGEWTRILFTLSNQGTAEARFIRLRLTLDNALDHSDLLNRPRSDRQVFVDVDRVAAGQSRRFRLEVRPTLGGEASSMAEVLLNGSRVDRKMFRLVANESSDPVRPSESLIR